MKVVHWKGADGWDMQGLYYPPVPASAGSEVPPTLMYVLLSLSLCFSLSLSRARARWLTVGLVWLPRYVHGGPIGVQTDSYVAGSAGGPCSIGLLQQAGYAVFSPNYRGSVG